MRKVQSRRSVGTMWFLVLALGCASDVPAPANDQAALAKDKTATAQSTILFVGTSLTAGYGLDPAEAWPTLIQQKLTEANLPYRAVNAGVSGETSAGALRRIDWLLDQDIPRVVMIETGANDGLRGQSLDSLEANLGAIVTRFNALRPRPLVIVAGMEALPNLGAAYTNRFRGIFPRVARANGATYLPFLLDGVAGNARFNQADGIHPNPEGAERVAENVWRVLEPVLDSLAGSQARR
jgi:acyl-CoA thioesterase I